MTEQYRYSAVMTFMNNRREAQEISMDVIQFIVIDKDYENNIMPVITTSILLDSKLRDKMILEMDDSIVSLQIYKFNKDEDDRIGQTILNDIFVYMIPGDISHSQDMDYKDEIDEENPPRIPTTVYLIKRDSINNNRQVINCVNRFTYDKNIKKQISMTDMVMRTSAYLRPLLLEPITNNKSFDEIVIPPLSSLSDYVNYLNDNICSLYPTGYRFFMDFDTNYIISKSGKKVEHKDQNYHSVIIDIGEKSNLNYAVDGNLYNSENRFYHVPVSIAMAKFQRNITAKHLVTQVACIDSSGTAFSEDVSDTSANIKEKLSIMQSTTSNSGIIDNVKNDVVNGSLVIDIVKPNLDASIFTINKEYIINNTEEYKDYDGRYLICCAKQFFIKEEDGFAMNSLMRFKKISQ